MSPDFVLILLAFILALILAFLAAIGVLGGRITLLAASLACYFLSLVV